MGKMDSSAVQKCNRLSEKNKKNQCDAIDVSFYLRLQSEIVMICTNAQNNASLSK
jgi:hypothetical protein